MTQARFVLFCFLAAAAFSGILSAQRSVLADEILLLPSKIALSTTEARQRLLVERQANKAFVGQVREGLEFTSSNEKVVRITDGVAVPTGNGVETITVKTDKGTARAEVVVNGQDKPFEWSFRNHVESVLSKTGCNGGACHGARAGKNGFRLTLFGFDLDADYSYLTRQANGRRIVPTDPGRSLLLTKPTGMIPHKGGVRFEPDSLEYRVLAEWIAAGTPGPRDTDTLFTRLEVLPKYSRQTMGATQQLIVLAHFNNGQVEDVTRWAKYTSANSSVASVSEQGQIDVTGPGEGAVKVWYLNHNEMAFLSVPYPGTVPPDVFAKAERRNFIDNQINAKLQSLNILPSPACDDATFLRRAYLDAIGVLPTTDETQAFLADGYADKRDRLIDQLLARPEFVDYWSYKWSDLLLVSGGRLRPAAVEAYYKWIRGEVAKNTPWDQFVHSVVTAIGSTHENGAANFYALHQDPEGMAETVAQAFMGLSINCAHCHNHPMEKWTNDQYYGFANMFSRVRSKGWGGDSRNGDGMRIIFSDTQGELLQLGKGTAQPPRPLDAEPLSFSATEDRRVYLANWLTSPQNPYFARTITNRVWANFFGVGLVEKVDDLRVTNPASNEELLNAAAQHLVTNKFDLKELMRAIMRSAAYQRSSQTVAGNETDDRFYSRYYARRLKAEVLLDAISQVTGTSTEFVKIEKQGKQEAVLYPPNTRAMQLPDANVNSYFLNTFGRPERLITCDCERSDEPSMTQVLHISNGDTINSKLRAKTSRLERQMEAKAANDAIIDELYLSALGRPTTTKEKSQLLAVLAETPESDRRVALEDVYWSVLSSREFLFNH